MTHQSTGPNPSYKNATPTLPTDRRAILAGIGGLAAGAFLAGKANAGPLEPPPGPIAPTPGPEPRTPVDTVNTPGSASALFRIAQPGSYYLTGNIRGQSGRHGIEIAANGVTLDLMGFDVEGDSGSLDGIRTGVEGLRNIVIRNGSVRKWPGDGVNLIDHPPVGSKIEGVSANANGGSGITAADNCAVIDCTASQNSGNGINLGSFGRVARCDSHSNSGVGITVVAGCLVRDCSASSNGLNGIGAAGPGNTITACSARANSSSGIAVSQGSFVTECTATNNAVHGIIAGSDSTIQNNNSGGNGSSGNGAGIITGGNRSRIEANVCNGNRTGIQCQISGNFIARNTCSANNTNWSIAANNTCLVIDAANAPAIVGDSGGASPGSADPNANFTY